MNEKETKKMSKKIGKTNPALEDSTTKDWKYAKPDKISKYVQKQIKKVFKNELSDRYSKAPIIIKVKADKDLITLKVKGDALPEADKDQNLGKVEFYLSSYLNSEKSMKKFLKDPENLINGDFKKVVKQAKAYQKTYEAYFGYIDARTNLESVDHLTSPYQKFQEELETPDDPEEKNNDISEDEEEEYPY